MTTEYRRTLNTEIWHFCADCSGWPPENYIVTTNFPLTYQICNDCLSKNQTGDCEWGGFCFRCLRNEWALEAILKRSGNPHSRNWKAMTKRFGMVSPISNIMIAKIHSPALLRHAPAIQGCFRLLPTGSFRYEWRWQNDFGAEQEHSRWISMSRVAIWRSQNQRKPWRRRVRQSLN